MSSLSNVSPSAHAHSTANPSHLMDENKPLLQAQPTDLLEFNTKVYRVPKQSSTEQFISDLRGTHDTQWSEGEALLQNLGLVHDFSDPLQKRRNLNQPFEKSEKPPVGLYRGGQPRSEAEYQKLAERYRIGLIIDLRGDSTPLSVLNWSQKMADEAKIQRLSLPLDTKVAPTETDFKTIHQAIKTFRSLQPDQSIYIHCKQGIDRTGRIVADYEMAILGHSPKQTFRTMQQFGYNTYHRITRHAMETSLIGRPCWVGWKAKLVKVSGNVNHYMKTHLRF